jgi:hypothetical protein
VIKILYEAGGFIYCMDQPAWMLPVIAQEKLMQVGALVQLQVVIRSCFCTV